MGISLPVLGVPGILDESLYFVTSTIAISPTLGSELVLNPNFDSDTSNWTASASTLASVAGGQSGNCLQVTLTGALGYGYQDIAVSSGLFYACSAYLKDGTRAPILYVGTSAADGTYYSPTSVNLADWTLRAATFVTGGAQVTFTLRVNSTGAGNTSLFDTISLKAISTMQDLHRHAVTHGDFSVKVTRAANFQGGVIFNYEDANNYAHLYLGGNARVYLRKVVGGSVTALGDWAITYGADTKLTARRHKDDTLDVIYGAATLASAIAATGLNGYQAGPWLTDAAQVSISEYKFDARYAT